MLLDLIGVPSTWSSVLLTALLLLLAAVEGPRLVSGGGGKAGKAKPAGFAAFQRQYLAVYLTVMLSDWCQGTTMYELYSSYGVDVGALFLTGFGTAMLAGAVVGPAVDRFGRRLGCAVFCVLEVVINLLEHSTDFRVLLAGRVCGGVSTALLFSAFEAWMVSEHRRRGFPEELLSETFSYASIGNGLMAISAGLVSQVAIDVWGPIGPFRLAIGLSVLSLALIWPWRENYGSSSNSSGAVVSDALAAIRSDRNLVLLGLSQALLEGALYSWVFCWVPVMLALTRGELRTGMFFSCLMTCITLGGALFERARTRLPLERFSAAVYGVAALCMLACALRVDDFYVVVPAFLLIEVCAGAFHASSGTMRARYVPAALMSTIINVFRVPLNLCVVIGTRLTDYASHSTVFYVCAAWLGVGCLLVVMMRAGGRKKRS